MGKLRVFILSAAAAFIFGGTVYAAAQGGSASDAGAAELSKAILFVILLLLVFQEAINGFHDAGTIIASVIYSNALKPMQAVGVSAVCNFIGVLIGGTAVALTLVNLLPVGMVAGIDEISEIAFLLAMITTAVIWNFTTWYYGIPNSTTHTYIGSILGVTIAHSYIHSGSLFAGVEWTHAELVVAALIISPVLGFGLAYLVYKLLRVLIKDERMYDPSLIGIKPPFYIRAFLVGSSGLLSILHGSNDGQKSIGLLTLAVVGLAPVLYSINHGMSEQQYVELGRELSKIEQITKQYEGEEGFGLFSSDLYKLAHESHNTISKYPSVNEIPAGVYNEIREDLLRLYRKAGRYADLGLDNGKLSSGEVAVIDALREYLRIMILEIPFWIPLLSALALGVGTAVGYKRIVRTLGEGIGKERMNAGHGTAAQLTASACIALADFTAAPVSTTQVVTSGVAGTMVASSSGLDGRTIRNIAVTWVTTLPGTMLLSILLSFIFYALLV